MMRSAWVAGVVLVVATACESRAQPYVDASVPGQVSLGNPNQYECTVETGRGLITGLLDRSTGGQVLRGNTYGPWVVRFDDGSWLGGDAFGPGPGRVFSFAVLGTELQLTYASAGELTVTLTMRPTGGPTLEVEFELVNHSTRSIELVAFPVALAIRRPGLQSVHVPYIEGIELNDTFFLTQDFGNGYPGALFADFAFTQQTTGSLGIYRVHGASLVPGTWLMLRDAAEGGLVRYHHDFNMLLGPGETFVAPTTVLHVGSSLGQAMDDYWSAGGYDVQPTLDQKLDPVTLAALSGAVFFKRDFLQGFETFDQARLNLVPTLPAGSLFHVVAFWPRGFDENYPDYLPPAPGLGTLSQFQQLVGDARSMGHLVMPYTNPTWWDNESPTFGSLGVSIATRHRDGTPRFETYNGHGGYVVCPWDPAVIARQDQTRVEFTQTVPMDFLFEDQIGARGPLVDTHASSPGSMAYHDGVVQTAAASAAYLPTMTEGGFDRVTRHEVGFCNSTRVGWHSWADSTFRPYPLAQLWAHDQLWFCTHNLAAETMSSTLEALSYHLGFGYAPSYDLAPPRDADWIAILDAIWKHLGPRVVGMEMTSFTYLGAGTRSRTAFVGGLEIVANLDTFGFGHSGHEIAADGYMALEDGAIVAGAMRNLNGEALAGSVPHHVLLDRTPTQIDLQHLEGPDTPIAIRRPAWWTVDAAIGVTAVTDAGETNVAATIEPDRVRFQVNAMIGPDEVDRYEIRYCPLDLATPFGSIDFFDVLAYLDLFVAGDAAADLAEPYGSWDLSDLIEALTLVGIGCG